jgi:hypothetical protein
MLQEKNAWSNTGDVMDIFLKVTVKDHRSEGFLHQINHFSLL